MVRKWQWMLDESNVEMFEHLCEIHKCSRKKLLNYMIALEADRLLADKIENNDLLVTWLKKHKRVFRGMRI